MQRQHPQKPKVTRWDKLTLAVLSYKLGSISETTHKHLYGVALLLKPETLLRWHRDLVKRKWTFSKSHQGGRPPTDPELQKLLLQLARENPNWGYGKLQGELLKLDCKIGLSTIRDILK